MERSRAERRHQERRAKDRSRRTWRVMDSNSSLDRASDPRWVGIRATTRCLPNQGHHRGKTLRDARADVAAVEQGVEFPNIKKSLS
jgi:hypothetical protein